MLAAVAAAEALVDRVRLEEMVAAAQAEMGEQVEVLVLLVQLTQEAEAAVVILLQEEQADQAS
tara:strand:- start:45 stop:233 length:189 start_codon:yes stop_codon:yes gene_type:complete